jgi:predicted SPOUT superfamily RNA methylase MTH1
LAGTIARALAVFSVDEVVIFDDLIPGQKQKQLNHSNDGETYTGFSDPCHFLLHLLSYLETPPYLRKSLFSLHPNLRTAGTLPSTDMPHHLRAEEWCQYREGVTMVDPEQPTKSSSAGRKNRKGRKREFDSVTPPPSTGTTLVNAGFAGPVSVSVHIPPNTRVTLKFPSSTKPQWTEALVAEAVAPSAPREEVGYYWGFSVRRAGSLSSVFTECPFDGGYDLSIGTSERGTPARKMRGAAKAEHILLAFGGLAGLEEAVRVDEELTKMGVEASELFDRWVNLVEGQGSRTIRSEEAIWIGLMGLRTSIANETQ